MERGTNDMRSAARIAEDIADHGGGVSDIISALRDAADVIEHGWAGTGFLGYHAGSMWDDGLEDALFSIDVIRSLTEGRRTVPVKEIREVLGDS